jgi:hypothetical protein
MLDDLGRTGAQLGERERVEHRRVDQHGARRVEGADQVLPSRGVDGGLPAHRRVDHGQQGRRALHDRDAAQVRGRHEAAEVPDHAPAERDEGGIAPTAGLEEAVGDRRPALARLVRLAGRDLDDERGREVGGRERIARAREVVPGDGGVGEEGVAVRRRITAQHGAEGVE